jgi:hypothetical protein
MTAPLYGRDAVAMRDRALVAASAAVLLKEERTYREEVNIFRPQLRSAEHQRL